MAAFPERCARWPSGRMVVSPGRAAGKGINQEFIPHAAGPVGVAVSGGYVYWSNPSVAAGSPGTTIGRAKLNGTDVKQNFISGASTPAGVAVSGDAISRARTLPPAWPSVPRGQEGMSEGQASAWPSDAPGSG